MRSAVRNFTKDSDLREDFGNGVAAALVAACIILGFGFLVDSEWTVSTTHWVFISIVAVVAFLLIAGIGTWGALERRYRNNSGHNLTMTISAEDLMPRS